MLKVQKQEAKMNARTAILFLIGLIILPPGVANAWNEPDGFRGIPFGASEQQLLREIPRLFCNENKTLSDIFPERHCTGTLTIGSVKPFAIFYLRDGRFVKIALSFDAEEFGTMETAFVEKYGRPTNVVNEPIKTLGGLEATNTEDTWEGEKIVIFLRRYAGTIKTGAATIETIEELQKQLRLLEQKKKKAGAKDL